MNRNAKPVNSERTEDESYLDIELILLYCSDRLNYIHVCMFHRLITTLLSSAMFISFFVDTACCKGLCSIFWSKQ